MTLHVAILSPFDPEPRGSLHHRAHVGGVERVLLQVARELARSGHQVDLVCSTDEVRETTRENGIRFIRVPRQGTLLRSPIVNLARRIPKDADVIHVPATYPFTTGRGLAWAERHGIPSVLDFHFEPAPHGWFGRAAARAYARLGPRWYPSAARVIVRSDAYARDAPSLKSVDPDRVRIVPNGIDPDRFHPLPSDPTRGAYVLFVGRLVPYKGLEVLLRALARRPIGMPLLVAGDGPLRAGLEAQARRLGVDVRFLGRVADDELPRLYAGARVTVLPSVNRQEAFGLSLVESMACGTPVVASALPGVADVARRGGLTAPPGDVDAWSDALHAALSTSLPRGAPLAQRIHAEFSWSAVAARTVDVYREALAQQDRAAPPEDEEVASHANLVRQPVL